MYRAIKRPKLYAVHCPIHYSSNIPALRSYGLLCYPAAQSPTPMLPAGGGVESKVEAHIPKAQGLEHRSQGPRPCNREGARGG